jgi:replicative DNA helicase
MGNITRAKGRLEVVLNYPEEFDFNIPKEEDLSLYKGEDEIVSSHELKETLKEKYKSVIYRKTSFPTINNLMKGFTGGDLTVISGITGNGKTLFCKTLTKHFSDMKENSLWFTYEVPTMQFLYDFGEELPHFYMPKILKDKSMEWIYNRVKESILKFNVKNIFIDHLHYLSDVMTKNNPSLEIGKVMRTLKGWSVDLNISTFLVAHMMKIDMSREPQAGDSRDSSFVEQEPDNVFYIWRRLNKKNDPELENRAIVKITKNRGFGIMDKKIELIKRGKYLVEFDNKYEPYEPFKQPSLLNTKLDDDDFGRD